VDPRQLFYSTIAPPPPGFEHVQLSKRHLLDGTVVILVRSLDELQQLLPDFRERMRGVVLVHGAPSSARSLGPLLWLLTLRVERMTALNEWLAGWLEAIRQACAHEEAHRVALLDNDRLRFELGRVREDYNRVTTRLQKQVNELIEAKRLLESWNEQLESKVSERTAELARSNDELAVTLSTLEQAQEQLLRSKKLASLGSLMAGFAHELNTPLGNALLSATTLGDTAQQVDAALAQQRLTRQELDTHLQTCRDTTDVIQRNLRRAADVIQHFKQVEGDAASSEVRQRFRLADAVQDAVKSFTPTLRSHGHEVHTDIPPDLMLEGYPGALGQVLTNLMSNAVRHGFDGRAPGRISISARAKDEHTVLLQFSDDGNGIPSGRLDKIFDPFYTTKLGQGAVLGLQAGAPHAWRHG
jgi:signal transduction histidine kinase